MSVLLFFQFCLSKVSKYEVISGPYFPVFSLNTGKYGPEKIPYLDTLHALNFTMKETFAVSCLSYNQTIRDYKLTTRTAIYEI